MPVTWLVPAAFGGLLLMAVPIAIHLLVRHQGKRIVFPSLRFLQMSRLAALRRRTLQDAALLVCRVLIIAASVAALAAPVVRTSGRDQANAGRVVRAVVVAPGEDPSTGAAYAAGAMRAAVFARTRISDSIADAADWLDEQPSVARELVVMAAFRRGQVERTDFATVPAATGIVLARVATAMAPRDIEVPVLVRRGSDLVRVVRQMHVANDSTTVSDGPATRVVETPIRVVAPAAEQALADAALRAVLDAGVRWPAGTPPLQIAWPGRSEAGESVATSLARAIDAAVAAPTDVLEPVLVTDEELTRWSRPPGPPPANASPVDEGDRRWLWGAALALLGVEYWLRRSKAQDHASVVTREEARVA
ncbi:MAG: BatA domain-containing protein [Vicinamibacterales bacterium]